MSGRFPVPFLVPAVFLLTSTLLVACGDGGGGLSRGDVEEIVRTEVARTPAPPEPQPGLTAADVQEMVRTELAHAPAPPAPQPGLTAADVEEIVREAMAGMPEPGSGLSRGEVEEIVDAAVASIARPEPGLTTAEAERIARTVVASIPPRSDAAGYTKFFVESAIARYEIQGLEATLAHYSSGQSVDGQWYVFIIGRDDTVIAHPDPGRIGLDLKGWVGIDANGYNFGPEMLSATEEGKWVSYVYQNPGSGSITPGDLGQVELKNAWVVRHDGLLFASGWYIDVDRFTRDIVSALIELFGSAGLEGTLASLQSDPGSVLGGAAESAVSYNASGAAEGEWSIFMADGSGAVVHHLNPAIIGSRIEDLLGVDASEIHDDGEWLTSESMRIWVVKVGEWVIGAGWHSDLAES